MNAHQRPPWYSVAALAAVAVAIGNLGAGVYLDHQAGPPDDMVLLTCEDLPGLSEAAVVLAEGGPLPESVTAACGGSRVPIARDPDGCERIDDAIDAVRIDYRAIEADYPDTPGREQALEAADWLFKLLHLAKRKRCTAVPDWHGYEPPTIVGGIELPPDVLDGRAPVR